MPYHGHGHHKHGHHEGEKKEEKLTEFGMTAKDVKKQLEGIREFKRGIFSLPDTLEEWHNQEYKRLEELRTKEDEALSWTYLANGDQAPTNKITITRLRAEIEDDYPMLKSKEILNTVLAEEINENYENDEAPNFQYSFRNVEDLNMLARLPPSMPFLRQADKVAIVTLNDRTADEIEPAFAVPDIGQRDPEGNNPKRFDSISNFEYFYWDKTKDNDTRERTSKTPDKGKKPGDKHHKHHHKTPDKEGSKHHHHKRKKKGEGDKKRHGPGRSRKRRDDDSEEEDSGHHGGPHGGRERTGKGCGGHGGGGGGGGGRHGGGGSRESDGSVGSDQCIPVALQIVCPCDPVCSDDSDDSEEEQLSTGEDVFKKNPGFNFKFKPNDDCACEVCMTIEPDDPDMLTYAVDHGRMPFIYYMIPPRLAVVPQKLSKEEQEQLAHRNNCMNAMNFQMGNINVNGSGGRNQQRSPNYGQTLSPYWSQTNTGSQSYPQQSGYSQQYGGAYGNGTGQFYQSNS